MSKEMTLLTDIDVKEKISAYVLSLLKEGWVLLDSLSVNGDWYPRLQFTKGNEHKELKVLKYNPVPLQLQDNGHTVFAVYQVGKDSYAENREDWNSLLR